MELSEWAVPSDGEGARKCVYAPNAEVLFIRVKGAQCVASEILVVEVALFCEFAKLSLENAVVEVSHVDRRSVFIFHLKAFIINEAGEAHPNSLR